ncbi:hypothetical protein B0H17DRAFT_1150268 [Mycena rosella]|uniref:DUF3456 domain-containing protein n=1 Tax=Mycena rosella TaxID=1033263 RepID=A0AAD7FLN2_MYCRO|nr:hypothetical protein B0H17DRAFT_1150268 [Mycena rosella]
MQANLDKITEDHDFLGYNLRARRGEYNEKIRFDLSEWLVKAKLNLAPELEPQTRGTNGCLSSRKKPHNCSNCTDNRSTAWPEAVTPKIFCLLIPPRLSHTKIMARRPHANGPSAHSIRNPTRSTQPARRREKESEASKQTKTLKRAQNKRERLALEAACDDFAETREDEIERLATVHSVNPALVRKMLCHTTKVKTQCLQSTMP